MEDVLCGEEIDYVVHVSVFHCKIHMFFVCFVAASTMYQYFVKIVPTTYLKLGGEVSSSCNHSSVSFDDKRSECFPIGNQT